MDINFKIPKVCGCGWHYFDSIPMNHMRSNKHNFDLVERRKAVQKTTNKSTHGNCEVCEIKNMRNLERHYLTNSHIAKYDRYLTKKVCDEVFEAHKQKDEEAKKRAITTERRIFVG
jgi:hypothetical protein